MDECIFCKIIAGEIPCSKLYEDDDVLAFLDIAPISPGHTLVLPKKHCENILDMDDKTRNKVFEVVQKIATAVKKGSKADAFNVGMNNGKAAGQAVMHAHIHIIPRFENDDLVDWKNGKYKEGEMEKYLEKIKSFL